MTRRQVSAWIVGVVSSVFPGVAAAAEGAMLPAVLASDVKIRLDGQPKEIPGTWNLLERVISGKSAKKGAAFAQGAIAYDDTNLYVAMRLEDDKIVRTAGAGPNEDHATLSIAFPIRARTYHTYQVELYPGQPGKLPGVVKIGDQKVSGAELVEAPDGDGLTFEAKIPWSAFSESSRIRVGMRAALRYSDFTAPSRPGVVVATSAAREGGALPQLLTESEYPLIAGMLREKGISAEPAREAFGNVGGDSTWERVALFDKYLVILGSRFHQGKEFLSTELSISRAKAVQRLELVDFDGDGAQEILLVYRAGSQDEYREVLEVLKVKPDESLSASFLHEVGMKSVTGELHNEVRVTRSGGKAQLEIAQGEAEGYEKDSYSEPKPSDMESCLLPWDPIKDRRFAWDSSEFKKTGETPQTPKTGAGKKGAKSVASSRRASSGGGSSASPGRPAPPPPRAPSADEMLDQIYASYRKERSVKNKKPRFDFVTDVAASGANERVLVHDRDIVCFGKSFRDGQSYVYTTIGVSSPDDIIDMTARDLTGDGKAEVLVRAVIHAKLSMDSDQAQGDKKAAKKPAGKKSGDKKSGDKTASEEKSVDRLVFMVFQIKEDGIKRIFAAETGRAIEGNLMLGGLRFVEGSSGLDIEAVAGRAYGFTKSNYPFPEDTSPAGGFEPMALPWGSLGTRRYRFTGTRYEGK